MKILLSVSGAFAGPVEIADGATIADLLAMTCPDEDPRRYRILVDRQQPDLDCELKTGDRVELIAISANPT